MSDISAALDLLGEQIWDTLTAANYTPACEDPHGGDGFDVFGDPDQPTEVVVIMRMDGILRGCPASGVLRRSLGGMGQALEAAGWSVRQVMAGRENDDFPVRLHVARPVEQAPQRADAPVHGAGRADEGQQTIGVVVTDDRVFMVTARFEDGDGG